MIERLTQIVYDGPNVSYTDNENENSQAHLRGLWPHLQTVVTETWRTLGVSPNNRRLYCRGYCCQLPKLLITSVCW